MSEHKAISEPVTSPSNELCSDLDMPKDIIILIIIINIIIIIKALADTQRLEA